MSPSSKADDDVFVEHKPSGATSQKKISGSSTKKKRPINSNLEEKNKKAKQDIDTGQVDFEIEKRHLSYIKSSRF